MIHLYKYQGETPLQALDRLRKEKPEYMDSILSYAGRLDPMAEGLLLVLVDDENKKRQEYLGLDKEYILEIFFGVSTDTGDILGKVNHTETTQSEKRLITQTDIEKALEKYMGTFQQAYPAYSSHPVQGKSLFQWAREGRLSEIVIPTHEVTIHAGTVLGIRSVSTHDLSQQIVQSINNVTGDFRQKEIIDTWNNYFAEAREKVWTIAQVKISCSSGTYMRSLAQHIGEDVAGAGCLHSLIRTKIGDQTVEFSTHS
jgi:tRNA pseudouridine55 synthase